MSASTLIFHPKATVEIQITIPWVEVKDTYEKIFAEVVKTSEQPGFRKGKAPKDLVEKNTDKTRIYEAVVKEVVPKAYAQAVKENNLTPISAPKIEVTKAKENEEWIVKAKVALKPEIKLKAYKEKVKSFKKATPKIWTPGSSDKKEEAKKPSLDDILKVLLAEVELEISDLLVDEEANRLLADLIDQTKKLGLTVEQYLLAKGKTTEQIRAEYREQAQTNLKIQLILAEIADKEDITVSKEDLDKLLEKVQDEKEKEKIRSDSYYITHLLRQQKTLDFLSNL